MKESFYWYQLCHPDLFDCEKKKIQINKMKWSRCFRAIVCLNCICNVFLNECFLVWLYKAKRFIVKCDWSVQLLTGATFCAHMAVCMYIVFCVIVWQREPWGWWELLVSVVRVDMVLVDGQQGFWWKAVVMLLKSTAPICPVCLFGSSPGWASACDDADSMTAGAHRGECQCGREQFPHDLQHIQTNTHSHSHMY